MKINNPVITTIKVDENKRDLAKAKGYKLQDLLDIALNNVLKMNKMNKMNNLNEITEIKKEIEILLKEKETAIKEIKNNKLELENKLLMLDSKAKDIERDYNIKIKEKELLIADLDEAQNIDIWDLEEAKKEERKATAYKELLNEYITKEEDYKEDNLNQSIARYSSMYEIDPNNLLEKLHNDYLKHIEENKETY